MIVLGLDTADDFCALALVRGGQVIDTLCEATQRDQARRLAPLTQQILERNGLNAPAVDRFAAACGPGSFTGLRVGLAFARGLGLATGKPVTGIDHFSATLDALSRNGAPPVPLLVIRDSKREELFARWYEGDGIWGEPFLGTAPALAMAAQLRHGAYITGNGVHQVLEAAPHQARQALLLPPEACVQGAARLAATQAAEALMPPHPLYLREADVSFPKAR